jgi:membrane protease YdiL (CAAX protease family)
MHLSLFAKGVDAISASVIVLAATALGLWAGLLRERSGSILPPLAAHIGFNVGGAFGGAAFVIVYRLSTGHFPTQLGTP